MSRSYVALAGTAAMLWAMAAQAAPTVEEKLQTLSEELDQLRSQVQKGGQTPATDAAGQTTVGGYGELHYNNLDSKKEFDFHRFVLFFNHRFSDRIRSSTALM